MTTLQDKLDNIYQTKLEIKSAIGTDSDVFSEYPALIRNMGGGGVSYSYLDERLSYYVETEDLNTTLSYYVETSDLESMGYITIEDVPTVDLSSYVTYTYLESKEYLTEIPNTYATYAAISEMGYITYSYGDSQYVSYAYIGDLNEITEYILGSSSSEAPENVYATKYELGSYVSKDELNNASYATESYVTNAISGIPSVDTSSYVTYTYLESKEYLTEIPSTYATYAAIEAMGYATTSDVNNYLNTSNLSKTSSSAYHTLWPRGLGITSNNQIYPTYLTTDNVEGSWYSEGWVSCSTLKKYVNDKLSDNIIPKENNTYTLGDASNYYTATYTNSINLTKNTFTNRLYTSGQYSIACEINGGVRYSFMAGSIRPDVSNADLGTSSNKWQNTYTTNLYADNAYINASTYLPVNTYWYDGSTYHWLGTLFS